MLKEIYNIKWEDIYKIWKNLLEEKSIDLFRLLEIKNFSFNKPYTNLAEYSASFWIKKDKVENAVEEATKMGLEKYCYFYLKDMTKGEYTETIALQDEKNTLESLSATLLTGACRGVEVFYDMEDTPLKQVIKHIQRCAEFFIRYSIEYNFHYRSQESIPTELLLEKENCKYLDLNNTTIEYWLEETLKILLSEIVKVLNKFCICNFKNSKDL